MKSLFGISVIILFISCLSSKVASDNPLLNNVVNQDVIDPLSNSYSIEKEELGRLLFWDPILSGSKTISCASCHHPNTGYAQSIPFSINHSNRNNVVSRNAPTILNVGYNGYIIDHFPFSTESPMFWDNRVYSLETQVLIPIKKGHEMRGDFYSEDTVLDTIVARLERIPEYIYLFENAFGDKGITHLKIAQAISVFERSLVATNSPFDQFVRGNHQAIQEDVRKGMNAFVDVGCNDCHSGPMFSDYSLHILSVPQNLIQSTIDKGNGDFKFRTPSLRNLGFTAPYMHNGVFSTLEEVLEFYDRANKASQNKFVEFESVDSLARKLFFKPRQKEAIITFLDALNDEKFSRKIPKVVPSGLLPGGIID